MPSARSSSLTFDAAAAASAASGLASTPATEGSEEPEVGALAHLLFAELERFLEDVKDLQAVRRELA